MTPRDIESRVGIFVLTGILVIAYLILHFGKFGDRFRDDYELTVRFQNASGLIPGSKVTYAGVDVGKVAMIFLDPEGHYVDVHLSMFRSKDRKYTVKKDAKFTIKRSGLLGDMYIMILPGTETSPEVKPGDLLEGTEPTSLGEMAESAEDLLRKLNTSVDKLTTRFLDDETLNDLKQTAKNMRELSANMNSTSSKLDIILTDVREGHGTVGKLFQSEEVYDNFKALSYNLRKSGVLFYKDRYDEDRQKAREDPKFESREKEKQARPPKSR